METTQLISLYAGGYDKLKTYVDGLPEGSVDYKPAPDKWSIREILVHLADSEANSYVRARKIIAESGSAITAYDQDLWTQKLFYSEMKPDDALALFRLLRKNMVPVLERLSADAWHNYIVHPESGKITLQDWIQLYIDHVDNHIHQMNRNLYDFSKSAEAH